MFKKVAGAVALVPVMVGSAYAALPAAVTTAVESAETDGIALVGLLAAAGAAVFIIAKLLRRFGLFL